MTETLTAQMDTVLALLRRLPPRERLRVVAQVLPEVERELEIPAPDEWDEVTLADAEATWEQELLERGLLSEIPRPLAPYERALPTPVTIPGRPLSEIILAERR